MKNMKLQKIIPAAVCGVFLVVGLVMMVLSIVKINGYNTKISDAQQALAAADPANADGIEAELAAMQAENDTLEEEVLALQTENEQLDESNAQLQSDYDELEQNEDTVYYRTVLESLTEGMNRVENYINGTE